MRVDVVRHLAVHREVRRERADVARALHVVLAAERVRARAGLAEVAGQDGEVREAANARDALRLLGDAEAVEDRRGRRRRVEMRRLLDERGGDAGDRLHLLRIVRAEMLGVGLEALGARLDERAIVEPVADDDVREPVVERDVRAGAELEEDVRHRRELDAARIGDDQLRAAEARFLHPRADDGMALGRVRAGEEEALGDVDVGERVRSAGLAERLDEAERRRRVADARAVVDVVRAERRAGELLEDVVLLVRAAARADERDRVGAVLGGDRLHLVGDEAHRLVPRRLAPRAVGAAHHRRGEAIGRARVLVREAALDAGVAEVRRARRAPDRSRRPRRRARGRRASSRRRSRRRSSSPSDRSSPSRGRRTRRARRWGRSRRTRRRRRRRCRRTTSPCRRRSSCPSRGSHTRARTCPGSRRTRGRSGRRRCTR